MFLKFWHYILNPIVITHYEDSKSYFFRFLAIYLAYIEQPENPSFPLLYRVKNIYSVRDDRKCEKKWFMGKRFVFAKNFTPARCTSLIIKTCFVLSKFVRKLMGFPYPNLRVIFTSVKISCIIIFTLRMFRNVIFEPCRLHFWTSST